MTQNKDWSQAKLSSFTHPLQHISREDYSDAPEEHGGKVSTGRRTITNLRFADDINVVVEEEQELETLVENLDRTCTWYKIKISAEQKKQQINDNQYQWRPEGDQG